MPAYAHSLQGLPPDKWEPLEAHLHRVATGDDRMPGAAGFAEAFGARDWGRLLGLWHDVGKYSDAFQAYLYSANGLDAHIEQEFGHKDHYHSTTGAIHAMDSFAGTIGRILAYCIAGHHGGLPDCETEARGLRSRLLETPPPIPSAPTVILQQPRPPTPSLDFGDGHFARGFGFGVFCRMLFSCLVDADYLATEAFMQPDQASLRYSSTPDIAGLSAVLDRSLDALRARPKSSANPVNHWRDDVLTACRHAARMNPGFFSLTVPTGGGKTLSSMSFALRHAAQHGLRRIIYAIPFTSIIEQNARVFREALGDAGPGVVLEHHCNLDPDRETRGTRFAAENWDAPVIVTTNVQFFDSLFANKPSRCRKLHRIARSVIILDEAQTLPVDLLQPTLAMLSELVRNYGCSIVLCSATQPAVTHRDDFAVGLQNVREIVSDVPRLFQALKRVELKQLGTLDDEEIITQLSHDDNRRVLCVVNTRIHAARLFDKLRLRAPDGVFHLSAQMCPAHRSHILATIRSQLNDPNQPPCRVISTQLVEAGVDIDFPVVYRAMAGLDSIMQAAGRCNREGRLEQGQIYLFDSDGGSFPEMRIAAMETREVAKTHTDLSSLEAIEAYFRLHYWQRKDEWDKHRIMEKFSQTKDGLHAQFREVAREYKLIRDEQTAVIVPYDARADRLIEQLEEVGSPQQREPEWLLRRRLQPYTVSVREYQLQQLIGNAVLEQLHEQYWVVRNRNAYDQDMGLRMDAVGMDPEFLQF